MLGVGGGGNFRENQKQKKNEMSHYTPGVLKSFYSFKLTIFNMPSVFVF